MKKFLFAVSAVALALSAGSAMAADLPSRKEAPVYVPPPPPPPMWTGFYVGLNIGGGWGDNSGSTAIRPTMTRDTRLARRRPALELAACQLLATAGAGPANLFFLPNGNTLSSHRRRRRRRSDRLQLPVQSVRDWRRDRLSGHQHQRRQQRNYPGLFTVPLSAAANGLPDAHRTVTGANISLPWFGTVRGRVGYLVIPTLLLYGTGGFAYGRWTRSALATPPPAGPRAAAPSGCSPRIGRPRSNISMSISPTATGTTAPAAAISATNYHPQLNVVRVGVNYHFNFAAPAPVVAKY